MGLFDIFKKKPGSDAVENSDQANSALSQIRELSGRNPNQAQKELGKLGRKYYRYFGTGRELHNEFKDIIREVWARQGTFSSQAILPDVEVIPWETWLEPKIKDITAAANAAKEEILYLVPPESRNPQNTLAECEALRFLAEPSIAMVIMGEENMFFRRSFILQASSMINPEYEEIGQDYLDCAKSLGLRSEFIVA